MTDAPARAWAPFTDLEIRGGDGRTVFGVAVPYDTPTAIRDAQGAYTEVIKRGAFRKSLAEGAVGRVKFLLNHDRQQMPLGRATDLREDAVGLVGSFYVSKTRVGDEALELVRDGVLDAFSVGFTPLPERDRWSIDRSFVERTEAILREVSLVSFPAYEGAAIVGVRSHLDLDAAPSGHLEADAEQATPPTEGTSPIPPTNLERSLWLRSLDLWSTQS